MQHDRLEVEKQNLVDAQNNLKSNDLDAMRSLQQFEVSLKHSKQQLDNLNASQLDIRS